MSLTSAVWIHEYIIYIYVYICVQRTYYNIYMYTVYRYATTYIINTYKDYCIITIVIIDGIECTLGSYCIRSLRRTNFSGAAERKPLGTRRQRQLHFLWAPMLEPVKQIYMLYIN